jgi:hypothetical protein
MRTNRGWWVALTISVLCGQALAWQPAQVTRYDETDFPGNDLGDRVGRARSFDDCAQRCLADDRCGAFTFNLNNRNCIPKTSGEAAQRNGRAVSGVVTRDEPGYDGGGRPGRPDRPGRPPPVRRYEATDFPGNDLDDLVGRARSFDDCARRCMADGRCIAFTYNLNNRNCVPKHTLGAAERNGRAVSGVLGR